MDGVNIGIVYLLKSSSILSSYFQCNPPHGNYIKFLCCFLCVRLLSGMFQLWYNSMCCGSLLLSSTQCTYLHLHIVILPLTWYRSTVCHMVATYLVSHPFPQSLKQFTHNTGHSSDIVIPAPVLGNASWVVSPLCCRTIFGVSETQGKDLTV